MKVKKNPFLKAHMSRSLFGFTLVTNCTEEVAHFFANLYMETVVELNFFTCLALKMSLFIAQIQKTHTLLLSVALNYKTR